MHRRTLIIGLPFVATTVTVTATSALGGCSSSSEADAGESRSPSSISAPDYQARAAAIVEAMTDADLVGQVLMPYAYGNDASTITDASRQANQKYASVDTPFDMVTTYRLGAMILVSSSADDPTAGTNKTTNVESPTQVRTLTTGLQTAAATLGVQAPMLIATDQEYGTVLRIKEGVALLPTAMGLGAGGDPAITEQAWAAAGGDLSAMGINVDFAPDADVLGDKSGGVIGSRSFGSTPQAVSEQVAAAVRGLATAGVAGTLKHFPGHGKTTADSHTNLPVLSQDKASLVENDLAPFTAGIQAGVELIMSGHLDVQAIDPGVASSFSSKVLIDLLRGELGFSGVVVTDSLTMEPARQWPTGEAAVRALVAGNDLLLMPPNLADAHQGLLDGLTSGTLPRERLIEAVTRVVALRLRIGSVTQPDISTVNSEDHQAAAASAAASAVTILEGTCAGALVTGPVRVTASEDRAQQATWLKEALPYRGVTVTSSGGTRVHLVGYGDGTNDLVSDAAVTVAMDTPYILANSSSSILVATFAATKIAMEALADVLAGKTTATGQSPVAAGSLPRSTC